MRLIALLLTLSITSILSVYALEIDSVFKQNSLNNKIKPTRIYYPPSYTRNYIKTDITSVANGILPIILEHRISDYFGIDGGLGLIMPYTIADFIKNDSNKLTALLLGLNPKFKNRSFGASLQIEPKFFISDDCIFSGHKGYNYLSIYCNFQGYRDQGIREFGLGYGVAVELSKINLQLITTFSLISLKRHHTNTDFKYNTSPLFSDELTANRFRLFFRLLIGFRSSRLDKYF